MIRYALIVKATPEHTIVRCPFCSKKHSHGPGTTPAVADCKDPGGAYAMTEDPALHGKDYYDYEALPTEELKRRLAALNTLRPAAPAQPSKPWWPPHKLEVC